MIKIKITFLGACKEVGRSAILVEVQGKKILLDAGIKLGEEGKKQIPPITIKLAKSIDFIVLTHGHLDHIGFVPALVKKGFRGKIYCTKPTRDLMHLLLSDAYRISKEQNNLIYSIEDIEKTMKLIEPLEFKISEKLGKKIELKFFNAGHILGSALVLLTSGKKKLLYTGDYNTRPSNILDAATPPDEKIDVLISESTYGLKTNQLKSMQKSSKELAEIIKKTLERKGKVLIPVFAVGRGQDIMISLENYIRSGFLPELNLFIDGMINSANKISRHNVIYMKEEIPKRILMADDDPFKSPYLKRPRTRSKRDVLESDNVVILATSGMLSGGPSIDYLKKIAGDKKNTIILVGYQAEGCLGRELLERKREIVIHGRKINVEAEIKNVSFSGHADFNGLISFTKKINPKKVFLIHGDEEKIIDLKKGIEKNLKKTKVFVPELKQKFQI